MAMLTTVQTALLLGITRQAVHKAIREKRLKAIRYGRDYQVRSEEVERYRLARRQRKAKEAM